MSTIHRARVLGGVGIASLVFALGIAGSACKDDRTTFDGTPPPFSDDAKAEAGPCPYQCSLDGRSVIRSCTGEVVETCAPNLACGAALCQVPCEAAAADRSSNGCEFYFQIPRYDSDLFDQSCLATFVVNASNQPVDVTVEYEGKKLDLSKALFRTNPGDATLAPHEGPIQPGGSAILFVSDRDPTVPRVSIPGARGRIGCPKGVVPALLAEIEGGTRIGSAMHLTTNVPIGLTAIYPFGGAASYIPTATLFLPVPTWGKQNILVNGWEANVARPGAQFFASEDDTEVTILPTTDIQDGVGVKGTRAKVPVTYRLDKGQYIQFTQSDELSGSIVESTKPIAAFGGHACSDVPSGGATCDTFHQQIPPFEQWGSEYVGVGYRPRLGNEHEPVGYRIVAARDGTRLDYDPEIPPGAPTALSAGEVATFRAGTGDAFVVRTQDAEHPIYLAAYMSSSTTSFDNLSYSGIGDPEFVNVVPVGQYLNSYSFFADPTYGDASLVFVRAKSHGEFKDVWLDCAGGNVTDFRPIGTRGEYEFARVDLAKHGGPGSTFGDHVCRNGLQRATSDGPFTATVWGWDYAASYAYPGGMALRKLVQTPLPPVR
ncbi:hypothetical protein AKJ09_05443 [Labilithrix luteola]|uniref:IgGFc-binding protein N-terminal domain-containing protein n=1 Tax=Labilithrix luteola TaxID=1391654 RepID=A0A0K1Q063_9BACT|nr:IgGFc-binding protein [Labilithrix luteola]AKU98779.1 hypothetical protein AKJ09_05443 [Labilithrix luteola]